jgi:hypothetical protein
MRRNLNTIRGTAILAMVLSWPATALAQVATVKITAPTDGTVIYSGQPFTVEVEAAPGAFQYIFVIGTGGLGFDLPLSAPPYRFALQTKADGASGKRELTATGVIRPGEVVDSTAITIDVERADEPERLLTEHSSISFGSVGEQVALTITGVFKDKSLVGLNRSTRTRYSSSDPSVVSVRADGLVTAVGPGFADVTVTHGLLKLVIPIAVPSDKQP